MAERSTDIVTIQQNVCVAWSARTSADGQNWSRSNAAWGQCAVTACYVQEMLGGELVRVAYETPSGKKGSHYFNILPSGKREDLTAEQFPKGTIFTPPLDTPNNELIRITTDYVKSKGFSGSTRDYVLSYQPTQERYDRLKNKIGQGKEMKK